jgi:hypothetical protein
MLEAVIEQMKLWAKGFLREQPSLVSILTHNHWHAEAPSQEQRLIAKVAGQASGINASHTACSATVTARENVELHLASRQQFPENQYEWRFS